MRNALVIEFPGWGYALADRDWPGEDYAKPPGIHQDSEDLFTVQVPEEPLDGPGWVFAVADFGSVSDVIPAGAHFDLYLDPDTKLGVFVVGAGSVVGDQWVFEARCRDLSAAGTQWALPLSGEAESVLPKDAFLFPYVARAVCSEPLRDLVSRLAPYLPEVSRETLYEDLVSSWTTQLQSEISVRGGLASSSGFTFTVINPARLSDQRTEAGSLKPFPDAAQGIEVLASQAKWTWGSLAIPGLRSDNAGMTLRSREYDLNIGTMVLDFTEGADTFTVNYETQDGRALYWGNDTTDWLYALSDSGNQELSGRAVTNVFGSYANGDIPRGAEAWSAPPSGSGRRVIMWSVDPGDPNPMLHARKVYDGYLDAWGDGDYSTSLTWQVVDSLSWLRSTRKVAALSPELSDSLRNIRTGAGTFRNPDMYVSPFDVLVDLRFVPETGAFEEARDALAAEDPQSPQWVAFGGYAFPHALLSYQPFLAELNTDEYPLDYTYQVTRLDVAPGGGFEPDPPARNTSLNVYLWAVSKLGVPLGDREDDFEFAYETARDISGEERLWWSTRDFVPRSQTDSRPGSDNVSAFGLADVRVPTGYLTVPSFPGDPRNYPLGLVDPGDVPAGRWTRLSTLSPTGDIFDSISLESIAQFRASQAGYLRLANRVVTEYAGFSEPVHVFYTNTADNPFQVLRGLTGQIARTIRGSATTTRPYSAHTVVTVSVAEVVLQVLLSTGTSRFADQVDLSLDPGEYRVEPGDNGVYDVLPRMFGLGLPYNAVHVRQVEDYRITPYSDPLTEVPGPGAENGVPLRSVTMANVVMTAKDAEDPAKWLEEQVLQPFGLALVANARGALEIRTMDSFDSEYVDPETGDFLVSITRDDLNAENHSDPVDITLRSEAKDLIQSYTLDAEDRTLRYLIRPTFVANFAIGDPPAIRLNSQLGDQQVKLEDVIIRQTSSLQVSGKQAVPISRNASLQANFEVDWTPFLRIDPGTRTPFPGTWWQNPAFIDADLSLAFTIIRNVNTVFRDDKVERWQIGKPQIRFEVVPFFPAVDLLTPGSQVLVDFPEVTNIDGSAGIRGIVLITAVQHDIHSGVRVVTGRVIEQEVPSLPSFGNYWAMTLPVDEDRTGLADDQFVIAGYEDGTASAQFRFLEDIPTTVPVRVLDQWFRAIADADMGPVSSAGIAHLSIDVPVDAAYVILRDLDDLADTGITAPADEAHSWRYNAFLDARWRWRAP